MTQRYNRTPARLLKAICSLAAALTHLSASSAQPPDPSATWSPAPAVGTCSNCGNWRWTNADGVACETFTCLGPGWPSCANQTRVSQLCTPGQTYNVTACSVTGVQRCTYTCNATGSGYAAPLCQTIGNGGNFQRTFCDYNAGCPVDAGFVEGRPATIAEQCTQDGPLQTITRGACGEGGCRRRLVWRLGQTKPVEVVFLAYRDTLEDLALRLMGKKLYAAQLLYGDEIGGAIVESDDGNFLTELARAAVARAEIDDLSALFAGANGQGMATESNVAIWEPVPVVRNLTSVRGVSMADLRVFAGRQTRRTQMPVAVPETQIALFG